MSCSFAGMFENRVYMSLVAFVKLFSVNVYVVLVGYFHLEHIILELYIYLCECVIAKGCVCLKYIDTDNCSDNMKMFKSDKLMWKCVFIVGRR